MKPSDQSILNEMVLAIEDPSQTAKSLANQLANLRSELCLVDDQWYIKLDSELITLDSAFVVPYGQTTILSDDVAEELRAVISAKAELLSLCRAKLAN